MVRCIENIPCISFTWRFAYVQLIKELCTSRKFRLVFNINKNKNLFIHANNEIYKDNQRSSNSIQSNRIEIEFNPFHFESIQLKIIKTTFASDCAPVVLVFVILFSHKFRGRFIFPLFFHRYSCFLFHNPGYSSIYSSIRIITYQLYSVSRIFMKQLN